MNGYAWLAIAIVCEVVATTALKASDGFSKTVPSIISAGGYGVAFYCMAQSMKTVPVGISYAIWSGIGIVLITLLAWVIFKQKLDLPAVVGMGMILAGVLVINLYSKAVV